MAEVSSRYGRGVMAPEERRGKLRTVAVQGPSPLAPARRRNGGAGRHVAGSEAILETEALTARYGRKRALHEVSVRIAPREITALIGPSGCGKSTLLRCFNRMNDAIPGFGMDGRVSFRGADLHDPSVDPIDIRRRVGMVFQKPNPFPKSIYDNVAFGLRLGSRRAAGHDEVVEDALRRAALWDEVKGKLKTSALALSGGQQQRLCIARCIAVAPEVILMDEPCSALDPIATARIEDLMVELRDDFTIVIVTHNMQQAARVADRTAFLSAEVDPTTGERFGVLVEFADTESLFTAPARKETEDYITGRFG